VGLDMQQGLLSAFNPSDALPAPRYTGMLLPIERDMYGNKGNFELAVPQFLQDAYSGINKFGQAFRGELSPQEIQQLAFDTSMNVTGGSLLGSRVIPNAVPSGGILGMGVSSSNKSLKSIDDIKRNYPNVDLDIYSSPKGLTLSKIVVPKEARSEGVGSSVMSDLVKYADENNLPIALTPDNSFGGNKTRLKSFYKNFGFVDNKGRNKDFSFRETMIRQPESGLLSQTNQVTPETGLLGKVDNVQPKSGISEVVPPTDKADGIFAFHGSGADFDKFKLSKIGTGEGAQVFGHGLYFTDSKDIAKFYKDAMLKSQNVEFNGKPISFLSDNQDIDNKTVVLGKIRDRILGGKYNSKEAIDNVKYEYEQTINNNFDLSRPLNAIDKQSYDQLKNDLDFINTLDAKNFNYRAGKTYEVKLNTITDNLINHDIPINQQSESMQSKVKDIMKIMPFAENAFFKLDNNLSGSLFRQELTSQVESAINNIATHNLMVLKGQMSKTAFNKMLDSEPFIKMVNEKIKNPKNITGYIGNPLGSSPKIASEIMNDFGIKGIKYKAGQLTAGQKDSKATNYVIFDDKIIDIMKKYGIVGAVGVTAMQGRGNQSSEADLSL
jgi:hypothetical protein